MRAFRPLTHNKGGPVPKGSKRYRTPSPGASRKKTIGQINREILARRTQRKAALPKPLSTSDSDSVEGLDTPNTVRMTGDSPQSPPTTLDKEETLEEKIARHREENAKNAIRRGVLARNREREVAELKELIAEADEKNNELDKELQELDDKDKDKQALCEEQQRTKQWIEDVRKAMSDGASIHDKLQGIEIVYPSLEIRENTSEKAPQDEGSPDQTLPKRPVYKTPLNRN